MGNSKQVAPPGEKPARRCAILPALGRGISSFLSFVKRPVRTRMRGVGGAGEGDLPGYPINRSTLLSLIDGSQHMTESPVSCLLALPARHGVSEAEVNAQ